MVLATHVIFTCYGFWLPNDPRGSWSDFVASWELFHFGSATKTTDRRSLARMPHDVQERLAAKTELQRPPVILSGEQARVIGRGFSKAISDSGYVVRACSILPDHVHLVIDRHPRESEKIVGHLKGAATRSLLEAGMHPFSLMINSQRELPSIWARRCWKVYLNSVEAILRAVRYVEQNPVKEGKRAQHWSFVTPFVGA